MLQIGDTCVHTLALAGVGIANNNVLLADALGVSFVQEKDRLADADAVAGWGRRRSFFRAKKLATKLNKSIITLEDGFLRSLDSGTHSRYGASFVVDDIGIYFDTTTNSRLENLILDNIKNWDNNKETYANFLIQKLIKNKLSKYNSSITAPNLNELANNQKPNLLIIDQVAGDASILGAGADFDSFGLMLQVAKNNFADHNIFIKAHPAGLGHYKENDVNSLFYLKKSCNPIALLEQCDIVFTVSSHMGFEALLLNKQVYNFGVAWYAGFGLTNDGFANQNLLNQVKKRRENYCHFDDKTIDIAQLFYSAYIDYSIYADPASCGIGHTKCDINTTMDYLIANRNHALTHTGQILSYRLSRWKSPFVRAFFATPFNHLTIQAKSPYLGAMPKAVQAFFNNPKKPYKSINYNQILTWGISQKTHAASTQAYQNQHIWCIEDGFIRSKGLGASLIAPLSIVCDGTGIYFDAKVASDLENLLKNITIDDEQNAKALQLKELLISQKLSKYNVGNYLNLKEKFDNQGKIVRLVVGQVEDDASILNCLSDITKNGDLLAKVRADFPNDFIIYKPHPDVEAGLRVGKIDDERLKLADFVAREVNISDCLLACDVLHTISSQAGFEALLYGKQVVCYGLPFYAGFGLTHDVSNKNPLYVNALNRRQRQIPLTLNELIYATLIAYPLYRLPDGYGLAQAQQVAAYLANGNFEKKSKLKQSVKKSLRHRFMQIRHWFLHQKS